MMSDTLELAQAVVSLRTKIPNAGHTMRGRQMKFKALGLACIAVAIYAIPAFAHHSFAMFDGTKKVTIKGTVKEFDWTFPHMWIVMMVPDAQGQPQQWTIEMGAPNSAARSGWVPKTLQPGMKVTAVIRPLKDGSHGGQFLTVTLPGGKVLGANVGNRGG
jgi:hypothetical protein